MKARWAAAVLACALIAMGACGRKESVPPRVTFASPEEAVAALTQAVKDGNLDRVAQIFGPGSQALIDSSDPETGRRNQQTFNAAIAERWRLESPNPPTRTLVIGNEEWPFPIPIVRDGGAWRFDAEAGLEEILARRIGRNELAVIRICRTYVAAQQLYARTAHDGRRAGLYAAVFRSDPGRRNGLYWPTAAGVRRSPLGDLFAAAASEGHAMPDGGPQPSPFHGYYFRILTAQGAAAPGGKRSYLVDGELSRGFALVAWPAQYDVTGVMTFIVNQNNVVHEKDLGQATDAAARAMIEYDPDPSWTVVQ